MISKEEAEKIVGKRVEQLPIDVKLLQSYFEQWYQPPINSRILSDWFEDVSIINFPEIASRVLTEEALFVIHPGFKCRKNRYELDSDTVEPKYVEYVKNLKKTVQSVLGKKVVLVWTSFFYKEPTLKFLGVSRNSVILVPTIDGSQFLVKDVLRMDNDQFYRKLSKYVKSANLIGEYYDACVEGVMDNCIGLIKTQRIKGLTYTNSSL